ncbi:uncharacterized protein A1O5_11044 [Cladophialophora psammophila CBS 110553]|uniref:Major facilitator superfamily (MFS) profile domain-containing protein n=1 Tax=Cladophialophora psammophila CBS 110553 TaxID=1182543 RepID=W9WCV4_9EURO|nr:uncharacterized protein A1O5_11044 [Cladophialophora psammophila CBS 110553]EXJ65803.1 hypothetical protein A1O5_11044 [Cladophialophora psammophila CBS 110553]
MRDQSLLVPPREAVSEASEASRATDETSPLLEQPRGPTTLETWASLGQRWQITVQSSLGLPSHLWFPASIFLLGIAADYCEGAFFTAAYTKISSEFQEEYNGALLKICYSTVTAVMRPLWSILSNHLGWHWPLVATFVFFICGMAYGSVGTSMTDIMIARAVTAVGASGMVFIPNLVFNACVPPGKLSWWIFFQAPVNLLGQFIGSRLAKFDLDDSSSLRFVYQLQICIPMFCAVAIMAWVFLIRPLSSTEADAPTFGNQDPSEYLSSYPPKRHRPSAAATFCVICLVIAVAGLCVVLNLLGELPERISIIYWFLLLFMILGGFSGFLYLQRSLTPADNLYPIALVKRVQLDVVGIFLATFVKDGGISNFFFVVPWFCQNALIANTWVLRLLWIGIPVGTGITALCFEKFQRVKPVLPLSALMCICSSVGLSIYMDCMSEYPTSPAIFVSWIFSGILGVGHGMMGNALHNGLIAALKSNRERQAMLYASFHLMSTLGDLVATAISNWALRLSASALMRRNLRSMLDPKRVEEIVQHCLKTDTCTAKLTSEARDAVRKSFLKASASVSILQIAAYLFLGFIVSWVISDVHLQDTSSSEENSHGEPMG